MADIVFILCGATSLLCAILLLRGYSRGRARLLLWSGLCFAFLTVNNTLLIVGSQFMPDVDLTLWRQIASLIGVWLLVFGLVWDAR